MVIGTPDIDQYVEPSIQFLLMVSDIGCEIGRFSIGLYQNTILLISVLGGLKP